MAAMLGWFSAASVLAFALEAGNPFGIAGERRRQRLDRDVTIELRIPRAIHLPHPAYAGLGGHFI